ncbi:pyruvate-flavodoxin oxidoreductase, partial [Mitsuokella multacida]
YNPQLIGTDKNPFSLDSKEPDFSKFQDFLMGENRYINLKRSFPEAAEALFEKTKHDAEIRYNNYKALAGK